MRKVIVAVIVDHDEEAALRKRGFSALEIFEMCADGRQVKLTPAQAGEWGKKHLHEGGNRYMFAKWVGRNRMLITTRRDAFLKLSDLSAAVGFDGRGNTASGDHIAKNRKGDWIGPFLNGRFERRRCTL